MDQPVRETREVSLGAPGAADDGILAALDHFSAVWGTATRWLLDNGPAIILIFIVADWVFDPYRRFSGDPFRLSGLLADLAFMIIVRMLFDRIPDALGTIWQRGLIRSLPEAGGSTNMSQALPDRPPAEPYLRFVREFERTLNAAAAHWVGAAFAILGILNTYPVQYRIAAGGWPPLGPSGVLRYYTVGNWAIVAAPLGYLLGLWAWRAGVTGVFIDRLGSRFRLEVEPRHPDGCGGLKPLGDLCLLIALLLAVPAVYLAWWGIDSVAQLGLWSLTYGRVLVMLLVLAPFVFLRPLDRIHRQMQSRRREILRRQDEIGRQIQADSVELRTQAETLGDEVVSKRLASLEVLRKLYADVQDVPVWPFDWRNVMKVVAAEATPILGLLGVKDTITTVIKGVLGSF